MAIKIAISDTDGCLVTEEKTVPPLLVNNSPNLVYFRGIKDFLEEYSGFRFTIASSRSLAAGIPVVELCGIRDLCSFEAGNIIYNPLSGEARLLVYLEKKHQKLRRPLEQLQEWSQTFDTKNLAKKLGLEPRNLRRLTDRKAMITFEILPYCDSSVTGEQLWQLLSEDYLTAPIEKLKEKGLIKVIASRGALDISVGLDKSDAVKYILRQTQLTKKGALGIGDSYHGDMPIMKECDFYACPSNSGQELKDFILNQGNKGFISRYNNGKGVSDSLRHFVEVGLI